VANPIYEMQYSHNQGFYNNSNVKCLMMTNNQVAEIIDDGVSEKNTSSTTQGLPSNTKSQITT